MERYYYSNSVSYNGKKLTIKSKSEIKGNQTDHSCIMIIFKDISNVEIGKVVVQLFS